MSARPLTIGTELPELAIVFELKLKGLSTHTAAKRGIIERPRDLNATIEVARHPVRARAVDLLIAAPSEVVNSAVL